ncbi:8-oxo-dGTP diphosphatase [Steroidobacter denitrificans]|uniref:8-oxo-dGTP diphosphatase n=1 Tax=Steroidobacter denitrificans TaxID=465721 RepID=A0A127F886_STEDE|nr:8-oxo-dGTP diphosphatase MutT [Steroidobacter denitrificans]AMN45851.1 8-oxo-dGTP diphosphatase [Steroidobacter denitrificans]
MNAPRPAAVDAALDVVAGALFDAGGRVLIAQRPVGKPLAGSWEFPGGKLDPGEAPYDALVRELHEELGIEVQAAVPVIKYEYAYPQRRVRLDLWRVIRFRGEPQSLDLQALRWARLDELESVNLLQADLPMIPALRAAFPSA